MIAIITDTIKSYLVSLGFQVNNSEYNKMTQSLSEMSKAVQTYTEGMTKAFVVASTSITSSLVGVAVATGSLIDQVAQADLAYQKFALRMYTTADVAKQLKIVTGAMGENINDIAWIPELTERYTALMNQSKQMEIPGDAEAGFRKVRDIRFEFTRMKVEVMYGLQWIAYYLIKYLAGPLDSIENKLKSVNDWITRNMPIWTEKVAAWIVTFINFGKSIVRFADNVIDAFKRLWGSMSGGQKAFSGFGALITAFFLSGPLGQAIMMIGTFLLLIDDFYAYMDGRRSSKTMAPLWGHLKDFSENTMPTFKIGLGDLGDKIKELSVNVALLAKDSLETLKKQLTVIFNSIWDSMKKNGVWDSFKRTLIEIDSSINNMVKGLDNVAIKMGTLAESKKSRTFWEWFSDQLSETLKKISALGTAMASLFDAIGLAMQGKTSEASKKLHTILPQLLIDYALAKPGATGVYGAKQSGGDKGFNLGPVVNIDDMANRIGLAESGGRYDAPGDDPNTNLGGKYQILKSNWPSWANDAGLGYGADYSPENQETVAKYKMQQMFNDYKAEGYSDAQAYRAVAGAWNGGSDAGESAAKYGHWGGEAGNYPALIAGMNNSASPTSYNPSATNQSYLYGMNNSSGSSPTLQTGDIVIQLPLGTNNPSQYHAATLQGVQDAFSNATARQTRSFAGVQV